MWVSISMVLGFKFTVYDYLQRAGHGSSIWSCSVVPGYDYLAFDN